MADPMTNMEIEDVLSSIRRLVSEDLRPGFRAESPVEPAGLPEAEGKLVLTPAFRVTDAASLTKSEEAQVWRRAASRYRAPGAEADQDQGSPEAAGDRAGEQGETGFSQLWPPGVDEAPIDAALIDAGLSDSGLTDAALTEAAGDSDGQDTATCEQDAPFIDVADDGDLGSDMDLAAGATMNDSAVSPISFRENLGDRPLAEAEFDPGAGDEAAHDQTFDSPPATLSDGVMLEAAIAELEAAVAASGDDWEPDGSELSAGAHFILPSMSHGRVLPEMAAAYGLTPEASGAGLRRLHLEPGDQIDDPSEPVWTDRSRSGVASSEPLAASSAAASSVAASMFAADEAVLDEGMLRELVIEVIRQELQGALGERITRNVRKLVRAEIHRAIAGREFE